MGKVACVLAVLEGVGPGEAVEEGLSLDIGAPRGRFEVLDGVPSPSPADLLGLGVSFRIEERLHAFTVQAAVLRERERE